LAVVVLAGDDDHSAIAEMKSAVQDAAVPDGMNAVSTEPLRLAQPFLAFHPPPQRASKQPQEWCGKARDGGHLGPFLPRALPRRRHRQIGVGHERRHYTIRCDDTAEV